MLKFLGPINAPVVDRPIGTARLAAAASAPEHAAADHAESEPGRTWIDPDAHRQAQRAVEGDSDDDWDADSDPDAECPDCGGAGYVDYDDEDMPHRVPCFTCGGRP